MIFAETNILARREVSPTLADNNRSRLGRRAMRKLNPQIFGVGVAKVFLGAAPV